MMQCGAIRYNVSSKSQIAASQIQHQVFVQKTSCCYPTLGASYKISDLYHCLVQDESRNTMILNDIVSALEKNRISLLLTQRTQHLQWFADKLSPFTKNIFILQGKMKRSERQEIFQNLRSLPDNEKRIILATGSYIGEGFDDPRLDTLFLALPVSWQGTLQQYVGRLHRTHQYKKDILV
jgi:superfamily II DNA or RNA helicase